MIAQIDAMGICEDVALHDLLLYVRQLSGSAMARYCHSCVEDGRIVRLAGK